MLTPWHITGFCDAAAAFTYSRAGGTFALYFAIKQKEENREILEAIREYFGHIGKIYNQKLSLTYRITKIEELRRILGHFDKYPPQIKKKDEAYRIWRDMVRHKLENYRDVDYNKLRILAERLSSLNAKGQALKTRKNNG
ncbi:MAG: LAGLIDADG family homing endonuclease [Candidatus Omnitrophica bacterium]|nr:LAGLIDADG family homing endonuclease [Candidatus Omnitrophota bacterium]